MILKYSIGLDISLKKIDACISIIDTNQKVTVKSSTHFSNTLVGFKQFETWIKKHYKDQNIPLVITMEATGIYYENCALFLSEKGYSLSVILPNKAKKYFQSLGLKSKNDSIDAKGLAQMGAEQLLRKWQPIGEFFYRLRNLTRQYQNIQENKTIISNQLHALLHGMYINKFVIKQLESTIKLYEKQLLEVAKAIKEQVASDPIILQKVNNICKIKGIAILTVATILAETNGFELFENSRQLVSYAGFDVVENQSGNKTGKTRISKRGNSRIRRALYMPSLCIKRFKVEPFIDLYQRTFEKHKIKMKSLVAVQKKLLTMIYFLWKKDVEFQTDYKPNNQKNIQEEELVLSSLPDCETVGTLSLV